MRKTKNILFFGLLVAYLITVSGFIESKERGQRIGSVKVRVTDSTENQFICTADIRRILERNHVNAIGKESSDIDLEHIESSLKEKQIINRVDAFITEPGVLHIEVNQKNPFLRVFNRYGQGYYLDKQGNVIQVSGGFSPYVLIANGYIDEPFRLGETLNIFDVKHDSLTRSKYVIYELYKLARYISEDDFWNDQIEQIYVNNHYEFELIPRVGSNFIEFGRADNLDEKFENLKILYLKGFNNLGWNKYEKISLKYKNQVVCTKNQ
jgi:cell division protein FtsQ